MAPPSKPTSVAVSKPGPKKTTKTRIVTLKLSSKLLARFAPIPRIPIIKEDSESKAPSSTTSNTLAAATSSPGGNASESNSNTPAPSATDSAAAMLPPVDVIKKPIKASVKRSAATSDGLLKPRGKPGPKKKVKLEDGTVVENTSANVKSSTTVGATTAHKLGPKANQGAINAGLRALDRTGKPCRKWQKGSFRIKTFTGTEWEIPRWSAPPKFKSNGECEGSVSGGSSKENKESSQMDSDKSNSGADIEIASSASINASSPAPAIVAAA